MMNSNRRSSGKPEKPHNMKATLKKLAGFCRPYLAAIIISIAFATAGTVFTIIGPDKLSDITNLIMDGIMTGIDIDAVVRICVFLAVLYITGSILSTIQGIIMATV